MKTLLTLLTIMLNVKACQPPGLTQTNAGTVITNVNVIDVTTGEISFSSHVYMSGGKIDSVSQKAPYGPNYEIIEGKDKYMIPGLIDAHVHTTAGPPDLMKQQLSLALQGGVTSVRDMGGDIIAIREWLADETLSIPDIHYSAIFAGKSWMDNDPRAVGSAHGGTPGELPWLRYADDADLDLAWAMQEAKKMGVTGIKLYADISEANLHRLVKAGKEAGLQVWGHATLFPIGPMDIVKTDITSVSHAEILLYVLKEHTPESYHKARFLTQRYKASQIDSAVFTQLLSQMAAKQIILDATLFVTALRAERMGPNQQLIANITYLATAKAAKMGVPIVAGTDALMDREATVPNLHQELKLLVNEADMTPLAALQAATINAALVVGEQGTVGQIKQGMQADILLLNHNPLENIEHTSDIFAVFKKGRKVE